MSKLSGFIRYQCDRCGKTAYLAENSVDARTWYNVSRFNAAQCTGGKADEYTLDSDCFTLYSRLITGEDKSFTDWMHPAPEPATNTDSKED
ncbi:hypothetical protein [Alloscardovia macacae]|uniref:Uncharacterized protein n=1 Tax=Alloscardovia macacae TaxID=1160091 RepID=A0A261F4V7_9BIFI|nr:hypothetical protein [Alloscardovia macacae]OZG54128.1 hypothetical protein ALMA_0589 [Alloscardovia macacae]